MAFVTVSQALQASRSVWATRTTAESQVRKSASEPPTSDYDIFMSHSHEDSEVIAGVKLLIEREGLTAYVDWIDDPQADRTHVTRHTADMLRTRMNHCKFLLYVSSQTSPNSKWMPWELGYFDGLKRGRIGVLPIVSTQGSGFVGQEYLALYPAYELLDFVQLGQQRIGRVTGKDQGELLERAVRGG